MTGRYFSLDKRTCLRRACFAGKRKKKCVQHHETQKKRRNKKHAKHSVETDGYEGEEEKKRRITLCPTILTNDTKKENNIRTCMVVI
jgi:hypothetical protein